MIQNSIIDSINQNLEGKTFVFALDHGNNIKKQILSETINKLGGVSYLFNTHLNKINSSYYFYLLILLFLLIFLSNFAVFDSIFTFLIKTC